MKKLAIVGAIIIALTGAVMVGNYRKKNLEEYARRNNCEWSYYYDEPVCK